MKYIIFLTCFLTIYTRLCFAPHSSRHDLETKIKVITSNNTFYYNFDCVIPREGKKSLLIDVQGGPHYFNNRTIICDRQKATHIRKYFSQVYELKYVWSHDFKTKEKVINLIKYWLGITKIELIDFSFKDVVIEKCSAKEYRVILNKYHYLPNAGRGGIAYGAYLDNQLIACCIFSSLGRQNIQIDNYPKKFTKELSRLCIHPVYQKKNFASWFVDKCVKKFPKKYRCIISYADTTFNHQGIVYKALGWKQDKIVRPDYWYRGVNGSFMSKRGLYRYAQASKVTEKEFAEKFGYYKIYGKEKLRFIFKR